MPKYFSNKAQQLHAEAYATYLLINSMPHSNRVEKLSRKAQARSARRFDRAYGTK